MSSIVNYQTRRYQDKINYSSVVTFFTDKSNFRFRFWVAKVRGNLLLSICLGNCFVFKFFWRPSSFKDGLNFDEGP